MKKLLILLVIPLILFANKKVSLQLEWKHHFEFAGFYAAKELGYYDNIGLDVEIKEYHDNLNISDAILKGESDFGISSSALILDKLKGKKVRLIASYFKQNVLALVTQKNIKSIEDLKGKKIMALPYEIEHTSLGVMLQDNGISSKDYTLVKHDFGIDKFLNSEVDAMSIFLTNQPYLLNQKHKEFNILNPAEFGLFSYDLELFTSEKFVKAHPKLTADFVEATNRGWKYAFKHKDEIINLIYDKYSNLKSKDALYFEAITTQKLFKTNIYTIGAVVPELILLNAQIYKQFNKNKTKPDFLKLIESYTGKSYDSLSNTIINEPLIKLTSKERKYLQTKHITMCIDPSWMPFEKLQNNKHIGMSADFFKIITKNLNTQIEIIPTKTWKESIRAAQEKKCDLMSLVMKTPEREKFLNFTEPYIKMPLVLVTHVNVPFISDLHSLTKKQKIAIPSGYAYSEILKKVYPNLNIINVKNSEEGLKKLKDKKIFGYIGSLATAAYIFQEEYTGQLKIASTFDYTWELGVGVRKDDPILLSIMDKAVESITPAQSQKIFNKWIAIKYEKGTDYSLLLKILAFVSLVIIFILYSNRKLSKLNIALHKAKEKADEIQNAKSNFLANVSHEIRTPMNSILGTTYLLRETTLSNIQKNYVAKIEHSTNNLLKLISDILDFSKLEAHKLKLSKVDFNLIEVLNSIHTTFDQNIYEKSLSFEINYHKDINKYLYGDNLKLLQILTNLISNAIKFTEKGKIEFLIEEPTSNLFRFSIIDTGIGLKQEQISNIFLSFTQSDSNTTRKYGGTGLGLAITKELVDLMDGKIWVNSTFNKGSKFIVEIMFQDAQNKQKIQEKKLPSFRQKNTQILKKKNDIRVQELLKELKLATSKRRPQLCIPIVEELEEYEMSQKQHNIFENVKLLISKYQFTKAGELL